MILGPDGKPYAVVRRHNPIGIRGSYDAAQSGPLNRNHWANTDNLSADAANSLSVRKTLRERARYEVANNSYARGILDTLANSIIGTGPRLQFRSENKDLNRLVVEEFFEWSDRIRLGEKLRAMVVAKVTDGEAFGHMFTNPMLPRAQLDFELVETDRVASDSMTPDAKDIDGVHLDDYGNVVDYSVLKSHPGGRTGAANKSEKVPAELFLHWFRMDRPGQHRGVSEITSALPLFAQLRRFTLAVITAAEVAADFAAVLWTDSPANEDYQPVDPLEEFDLGRGVVTSLPDGWKLGQVETKQPATTYSEFKREVLNEIARCLSMPYNIAACDSSKYNYASGRLDHQIYHRMVKVVQGHLLSRIVNPLFNNWLFEVMRLPEFSALRAMEKFPRNWFFDGWEHVDPYKEAVAQASRLENGTTTLAIEYVRQGLDWEEALEQRGREIERMRELGIPLPQDQPASNGEKDK